MSRTQRNVNPYYMSKAATSVNNTDFLNRQISTKDGVALHFIDAGDGVMLTGKLGKRFAKQLKTRKSRRAAKIGIQIAMSEYVDECINEQIQDDLDESWDDNTWDEDDETWDVDDDTWDDDWGVECFDPYYYDPLYDEDPYYW